MKAKPPHPPVTLYGMLSACIVLDGLYIVNSVLWKRNGLYIVTLFYELGPLVSHDENALINYAEMGTVIMHLVGLWYSPA